MTDTEILIRLAEIIGEIEKSERLSALSKAEILFEDIVASKPIDNIALFFGAKHVSDNLLEILKREGTL